VLQRFVASQRRRNTDPLAPWIEALSLVRLGLVDPVEAEGRYAGDVTGLAEVLPHYEAALAHDGVVDFDGQIDRAIRTLLTDAEARDSARRACRVLLVDEFQDLTPAHLMLVRLLAGPAGAVFGVGDDDQTIYGYNGADPDWLIDFARWFPNAGDHPLEVNYRCPAGVVDIADRLLRHNRRRVAKTIRSASSDDGGWLVADDDDSVAATTAAVRAALDAGSSPAEIAVLTRVNAVLAPVQVALGELELPISGGVGTEFMERTAVRSALAWLRLSSGRPFSPGDLGEALRRPSRSLHPRISEWVGEQRDVDGLLRLADRLTSERDANNVAEFAGDIGRLQAMLAQSATTRRLVDALIDDIGLGGAVTNLDRNRHGMNRGAQGDDLLAVRQLADLQPDPAAFEPWLRDRLAVTRGPGGVTLATVHRVKGQEWPTVVVHQAGADQYPHRLADDEEEERRLFHVAITRASRSVTIVPGATPSPFVAELVTEPPAVLPPSEPRRRSAPPPTSRRGPKATPDHPLLDRGRVMAVEGMVLVDQGQDWVVVELTPECAVARRGEATRDFALGAKVETRGRQRGELGPRPGDVEPSSAVAFDLLRQFRERARNGKPAYTVFDDKTLAAIATAMPDSLDELARVRGVGPAKLEQYGDSVLGVVAEAVDSSSTPT
jgi:DNA helicase-2/ATP-dependent DNA helicase PcrA